MKSSGNNDVFSKLPLYVSGESVDMKPVETEKWRYVIFAINIVLK